MLARNELHSNLDICPNSKVRDEAKSVESLDEQSSSSAAEVAVRFSNVSFAYDSSQDSGQGSRKASSSSAVLEDLSFTLPRGRVVSLLGPSGCGKTSVLRLIAGLERVDSGQIFLHGREVSSRSKFTAPELRAGAGEIGMVFQDFALFPHLRVHENLGLALSGCDERARLAREDNNNTASNTTSNTTARANPTSNAMLDVSASRKARIASILEMVELTSYADKYPQELSGGQQQRVALARALVASPRLLLLDEPFANLDVRLRDRIRDRTLHLLQSLRCSVLLVTHDAEEGMYMANSLFVMDERGSLVQSGSPRSIYERPRDAFVASLLSEVNRFSVAILDGYVSTPFGRYPAKFSNGSAFHGSAFHGSAFHGSAFHGSAFHGSAFHGSAFHDGDGEDSDKPSNESSSGRAESGSGWAEVVIRPQSLSLSSADSTGTASASAGTAMGVVEAARMIGGHSLVHLSSCLPAHNPASANKKSTNKAGEALSIGDCEHDCEPVHLHARVAGCFLPSRGTRLRIAVSSSDVFLFEQKGSRSE